MKKAPSFIPKETARLKEFERKIKEMDDKITNIIKTSKNDIIPIIEKRLLGIREELENKASTLDVKKMLPQVTEATEIGKKVKEEIKDLRENGLFGEKGKKMVDDINLSHSKIAQLDGKFTWLHTSHKDLMKKFHDSLNASQPLMMNAVEVGAGISDSAITEIKEEIERQKKEINGINVKLKESISEIKEKLNEKVDDRALNELEDQLTTDIDQTIKSFNKKFAEKQDTKKNIRHLERQIRFTQETLGIAGTNFPVYNDNQTREIRNKSDYLTSTPHENLHRRNNSALELREVDIRNTKREITRRDSPLADNSKSINYQLTSVEKSVINNFKIESINVPNLKLSTIALPQGNISSLPQLPSKEETFIAKTQRTRPIANIIKAKLNK